MSSSSSPYSLQPLPLPPRVAVLAFHPLAPHHALPLHQEYRDTTLNGAVEQMYQEMGSRHRVRTPCIQIIKTATLTASQVRGAAGRAGGPWQCRHSVEAQAQCGGLWTREGFGSGGRGRRNVCTGMWQCTCMLPPVAGSARCPALPRFPTALLKCVLHPAHSATQCKRAATQQLHDSKISFPLARKVLRPSSR